MNDDKEKKKGRRTRVEVKSIMVTMVTTTTKETRKQKELPVHKLIILYIIYLILAIFALIYVFGSPPIGSVNISQPPLPPVRQNDPLKSVYFGQGCFWHTQYDMFLIENVDTQYFHSRGYENITSLVGYAGGKYTSADSGYVCYHNGNVFTDYNKLGHAEAVSVELSYSKGADTIDEQTLGQFKLLVSHFFEFGYVTLDDGSGKRQRLDPQDRGPEYRSVIGIPGGMKKNKIFYDEIVNANKEYNMELIEGKGSNFGDVEGEFVVYIYDSLIFPFYRAENYHQFHTNDVVQRQVPISYLQDLKNIQQKIGRLASTGCPETKGAGFLAIVNGILTIFSIIGIMQVLLKFYSIFHKRNDKIVNTEDDGDDSGDNDGRIKYETNMKHSTQKNNIDNNNDDATKKDDGSMIEVVVDSSSS